jgi:hypothetical protein
MALVPEVENPDRKVCPAITTAPHEVQSTAFFSAHCVAYTRRPLLWCPHEPQIQFREKVLWTAVTLVVFLVCCQVCCCRSRSAADAKFGASPGLTPCDPLLPLILFHRSPSLASCRPPPPTLSTGCVPLWPPTEVRRSAHFPVLLPTVSRPPMSPSPPPSLGPLTPHSPPPFPKAPSWSSVSPPL